MKCLVLLSFVAVAFARPDVSHLSGGYNYKPPAPNAGYDYKAPHTSYGVPIQPVDYHSGGASNQQYQEKPSGSYLPSNQQLPSYSHVDFSGNHQSGSHSGLDGLYNPSLIQDQKHVYYFAARDLEEEQPRLRINVIPNHQKNTNVVFVKAPSYSAPVPEIHAPASSIEDKTKVVVLVNKPEQHAPINVHTPPAIKHGKPEVFVVKYKDQHEAERAVASGNGGYPLGAPVDQVRSEHHFVETLKNQNDDKYRNLGNLGNLGVSGSSESANAGLYNRNSGSGTIGIRLSSEDGVRRSSDDVSSFGGASFLGSSLADSSKDGGHISETFALGDSFLDSKVSGGPHGSSSGSSFESSSSGTSFGSSSGRSQDSGRGLKITIENENEGEEASSGSSLSDAVVGSSHTKTLEDDSLFSKYGPPGESGPY